MRKALLVFLSVLAAVSPACRKGESKNATTPATQPAPTSAAAAHVVYWGGFRGPTGDGIAPESATPPQDIDAAKDVLWKSLVPAAGCSSPIVCGDQVFLTGQDRRILAFDRQTGKLLWDTALTVPPPASSPAEEEPFEPGQAGLAAPTAFTDGRRVYAFFGCGTIGCVDLAGKQVWAKQLVARPVNRFGLAASPVVCGPAIIQQVDLDPDETGQAPVFRSFIVALRCEDGAELWRQTRPVYSSWPTPLLIGKPGREAVVTCADPWVIAYSVANGRELWRVNGLSGDVAASPVAAGGLLYAAADPYGTMLAIRLGGAGDITNSHVAWTFDEDVPEVAGLLCDGRRYFHVAADGTLRCLDAATGSPLWTAQLDNTFYASPTLADGRLFLIDIAGSLYVIDPASGQVLHKGSLGEPVNATPAFAVSRIYIRTEKHLLCLGRE
ncbi:MAG: PQQ-binding-like beta-propeller repeat protein [Planctomycetes bacterium]|nr:PQQ-binding-like beta-propeller repeat protein [Planctomycetota bacterium]